jgi:hypothetical protein
MLCNQFCSIRELLAHHVQELRATIGIAVQSAAEQTYGIGVFSFLGVSERKKDSVR